MSLQFTRNTTNSSRVETTTHLNTQAIKYLFNEKGILQRYFLGIDLGALSVSTRQIFSDRTVINIGGYRGIVIPKEGIQEGVIYECTLGEENSPRVIFRLGQKLKARKVKQELKTEHDEVTESGIDRIEPVQGDTRNGGVIIKRLLHITKSNREFIGKRERVAKALVGFSKRVHDAVKKK